LVAQRLDVLHRERRGAGALRSTLCTAASKQADPAWRDGERVRAEALDPALHRDGRAVPDRDEDDHRRDADRDAEHREERARAVREHALKGHPDGLADAHATACRETSPGWNRGGRPAAGALRTSET